MAFCHIYARKDDTFTVRMGGAVTKGSFAGGTATYVTHPGAFATIEKAREWIDLGRERDGLEDMPDPTIIRR